MNPWDVTELNFDVSAFTGQARLFPLPNLVLYPHVMQPLHIFEDRYREMLEDALAGDQLIAMAVLEPGWETDYESRPPVSQFACLGKVVTHCRTEDGRYNMLLMGVGRVRIVQELAPLRSFRQARVELLEDSYDFASTCDRKRVQDELMAAFQRHLPSSCELPEHLESVLSNELPLGFLTDLAAYALTLTPEVKLQLLGECCVRKRAETLLREVKGFAPQPAKKSALIFPPAFSDN
ncbi:MAG TPA: LON peptidase substrate-binding domain-containing protein [Lacipirellulaceae bacterium]|jgi:Lon protease-like protein|nr:LON peptidase substrate-binding domain-containing protein [Lacipirellulaceae bacterium]